MRFTFIPGLKYVVSPACKTGTPVLVTNVSKDWFKSLLLTAYYCNLNYRPSNMEWKIRVNYVEFPA